MSRQLELNIEGSRTVMDMGRLPLAHPFDVDAGHKIRLTDSANGPKRLLIFLTAADCSSCLAQTADWIDLAKAHSKDKFEVDMLFLHTAPTELSVFRSSYHLPYRVLLDQDDEIATLISLPPKTPVSILVDGKFHVLAVQGPEQGATPRRAFVANVATLINK